MLEMILFLKKRKKLNEEIKQDKIKEFKNNNNDRGNAK